MESMLFVAVSVGAAVVIVSRWFQHRRRDKVQARALLSRASVMSIQRALEKPGQLVKIYGELRYAEEPPLISPLSKRGCAYFQTIVKEHKGNETWVEILEEQRRHTRCWIDDGSGTALIELAQASVVVHLDKNYRSGSFKDAQVELEAFLRSHNMSSQGMLFNKTLSYREGVLEEGEKIVVCGRSKLRLDPSGTSGSYRAPPKVLEIIAPEANLNAVVTDDPDFLPPHAFTWRPRI